MLSEMPTEPATAKKAGPSCDFAYTSSKWELVFGDGRLAIIDYVCPNCHKNIHFHLWKATYCPHCGAPVFGALRKKLDGKQGRIGRDANFLEGQKYAGPDNRSRLVGRRGSGKPSGFYSHRPGPKDRGKHSRVR